MPHTSIDSRDNVLIVPYDRPYVGGPDLEVIPDHARRRHAHKFQDEFPDHMRGVEAEPLSGRYMYGGPMYFHFGHVMTDSTTRLWGFDRERHAGVVFAGLKEDRRTPEWWFDVLALFGLSKDDVLILRRPTIVESLDFPRPGSVVGYDVEPWYIDYLDRISPELTMDVPPRIYFGRTHLIKRGTLMGESYFASQLEKSGFVPIRPEKHPLAVQMAMAKYAEAIVFAEGSSVYSVCLVGRTNTRFFMIPRRPNGQELFVHHLRPRTRFYSLGDDTTLVRLSNSQGKNAPNSPTFGLDPKSIYDDLVEHGLISKQFDMEGFRRHERQDTIAYWDGDDRAFEQLATIAHRRSAFPSSSRLAL